MAKIIITNLQKRIITFNGESMTILEGAMENGLDWMHACGAKGRCTTCAFTLMEKEGEFSPLSEPEIRFRNLGRLGEKHRLACQTRLSGTAVVKIPRANQLPHLTYDI